eukprot:15447765-Alexandrium_andersonii.AAC.1
MGLPDDPWQFTFPEKKLYGKDGHPEVGGPTDGPKRETTSGTSTCCGRRWTGHAQHQDLRSLDNRNNKCSTACPWRAQIHVYSRLSLARKPRISVHVCCCCVMALAYASAARAPFGAQGQ